MSIKSIALIGFGEVGQTLAAGLPSQLSINAFDIQPARLDTPPAHVQSRSTAAACAEDAQLVISAVTAEATVEAARAVSKAIPAGAFYLDVNSASPSAKVTAAECIERRGGRYIEASIMSPIHPKGMAAPILLGGSHARTFEGMAEQLGFANARFYADTHGPTAAVKLCRSVMVKGMEALITESLLAAQHYGVEEDVLASLGNLFPHPDWPGHSQYMISRTLQHGQRRAEEMREAASTVADAGVTPWMSDAAAKRQDFAASLSLRDAHDTLDAMLAAIRAAMEGDVS